jgi:TPR repeat protein
MNYTTSASFTGLVVLALSLFATACGDQSPKGTANYEQGAAAYSKGDFVIALENLRPLAEQGNPDAQFRLGLMYREGKGVPQDDKQATAWLIKAAEQGQVEAQENVGFSYAKGLGVERDWVQADKWFAIAAASGKESAIKNQEVVEVHMQPEMIAQAKALAQDWLAKHKK